MLKVNHNKKNQYVSTAQQSANNRSSSNSKSYSSYRTVKKFPVTNFYVIVRDTKHVMILINVWSTTFPSFSGCARASHQLGLYSKRIFTKKEDALSLDPIRWILWNIHCLLLMFHIHSTKEVTLKTRAVEITFVVYVAVICIHLWIFIFLLWRRCGGDFSSKKFLRPSPPTPSQPYKVWALQIFWCIIIQIFNHEHV